MLALSFIAVIALLVATTKQADAYLTKTAMSLYSRKHSIIRSHLFKSNSILNPILRPYAATTAIRDTVTTFTPPEGSEAQLTYNPVSSICYISMNSVSIASYVGVYLRQSSR